MKQGIYARAGLSPEELEEVRALWEICNAHESIEIKLNWGTLSSRPALVTNDFVYYENDRIVGFLSDLQLPFHRSGNQRHGASGGATKRDF